MYNVTRILFIEQFKNYYQYSCIATKDQAHPLEKAIAPINGTRHKSAY